MDFSNKRFDYKKFREKALENGLTEDQIYSISLSFECGLYKAGAMELYSILKTNGRLNKEKADKVLELLSQDDEWD